MKYCSKFYELSSNIKEILIQERRKSWLVGEHECPFGTIPMAIYYEGSVIPSIHMNCIGMSMVLTHKMYPSDKESCCGYAYAEAEDANEDGGVIWTLGDASQRHYCDKFYELTYDIKSILAENDRKVLLVGYHESPFGTIPARVWYSGEILDKVVHQMEAVNLMLFSKWDISDDERCIIETSILADTMRGLTWEI